MGQITWTTGKGFIGTFAILSPMQFQLLATDSGNQTLTYKITAGSLPDGLSLSSAGLISGTPALSVGSTIETEDYEFKFLVRATNEDNKISDRSFIIKVNSDFSPRIVERTMDLGTATVGAFASYPFSTTGTPYKTLSWEIVDGALPPGLELDVDTGIISGYPQKVSGSFMPADLYWGKQWDVVPWDATTTVVEESDFYFTLRVSDGARYDQVDYKLRVETATSETVDSTLITVDSSMLIDIADSFAPYITTVQGDIPVAKEDQNYAVKIQAEDFNGAVLNYRVATGVLPRGIELDQTTGWIFGHIGLHTLEETEYQIGIQAYKASDNAYVSDIKNLTITVKKNLSGNVEWVTQPALTIGNGDVSQLAVEAVSVYGEELFYYQTNQSQKLPRGLKLIPSGLIVGRCSFSMDQNTGGTPVLNDDGDLTGLLYSFTVAVTDTQRSFVETKAFTILVENKNAEPYESLYLRALMSEDDRTQYASIINDTTVFPREFLYRPDDSYFGKSMTLKTLLAAGLEAKTAEQWVTYMQNNHYRKRLSFGDVRTVVALDNDGVAKYEVVVVEIVDPENPANYDNSSVIDTTGLFSSPYNTISSVFPSTLKNMKSEIEAAGYQNRNAIPEWMTSYQVLDGEALGFVNAVVLAYVKVGYGNLVRYRVKQRMAEFVDIDFVVDRYHEENVPYYEPTTEEFITEVTTFDLITGETTFDNGTTTFGDIIDYYVDNDVHAAWQKFPSQNPLG